MTMRRTGLLLALGAALSSCSQSSGPGAPQEPSRDEEQALEKAAEMLDEHAPADAAPADSSGD